MTKWWMVIPLGIAGLLAALTGKKKESSGKKVSYTVEDWIPLMELLAANANLPQEALPFVMAWMQHESGGNPCAWGTATAKGPDGHPREQGIGQLYNPDDFTRFDIPSGAFRVYCIPGTQKCSRELTAEEMMAQAKGFMKLVTRSREVAGLASAKVGLQWTGKDRWKLVKLVHGLPGLVKQGLSRTTTKLGRPPKNWQEFKVTIDETKLDDGTERYRAIFPRLFANAEKTAAALPDDVRMVS